jgi:hypothetical protein
LLLVPEVVNLLVGRLGIRISNLVPRLRLSEMVTEVMVRE